MSLDIKDRTVPLRVEDSGQVRVGGTRVTLDVVVGQFKRGRSPKQIQRSFDTLKLADIYATVAYYLYNQGAVEAYLRERERIGEEIRRQTEARYPRAGLRERLLARRAVLVADECITVTIAESPDKGPTSTCRKS
jgi:uncharacterized protein (DUF433 family)